MPARRRQSKASTIAVSETTCEFPMRKLALLFIFVFVFIVGGAVFAGTIAWVRMTEPYRGYSEPELFVEIPQGAGSAEIGRALVDGGIVKDTWTFRAALYWTGRSRALKAGEYRFDRPLTAVDVVERLARGDVYVRRLTFPEGLTIVEMSKLYESHGFGRAREFAEAARDVSLVADLDPSARDLEGYLYPETYGVARGTDASKLIAMMVARFRSVFDASLVQRAKAQDRSVRDVVTLASLVEKETSRAEERPIVAAVYRNRAKIGMAMQADPTVIYALEKAGRWNGNIRRDDLAFDSPYNTYKYPGLPPGPIASPGKPSLEAALQPADAPYLYFVSRNDGTHVFAKTLEEHNRNVQRFQVAYFRQQRADRTRQ
jgi:UPF0755 protein